MLGLLRDARLVLTDSGGIQEETTALAVPCLTLRDNTERPITVELGSNTIIGRDSQKLRAELTRILAGHGKRGEVPEGWDGRAAERVADHLAAWLANKGNRLSARLIGRRPPTNGAGVFLDCATAVRGLPSAIVRTGAGNGNQSRRNPVVMGFLR
jgi:hypothetical protein